MSALKKVHSIHPRPNMHWVGDGFPVRTIFTYESLGQHTSPFLLMDYGGPVEFTPTQERRGVGEHPHKGFETVTIVYQGALEHGDSTGNRGEIGPGDVQWMTAASGIVHEEFHARKFAESGGTMEMVQLWVNLPSKHKTAPPGYQTLSSDRIPVVALPKDAGTLRVIAGEYADRKGPARTFTPINLWDVRLNAGGHAEFDLPDGYNTLLFVLRGKVVLNGSEKAGEGQLAVIEREGERILLEAQADSTLLVLNGEPIDEPIAGYGPFVMNTKQEIHQAVLEYQTGKMGHLR